MSEKVQVLLGIRKRRPSKSLREQTKDEAEEWFVAKREEWFVDRGVLSTRCRNMETYVKCCFNFCSHSKDKLLCTT